MEFLRLKFYLYIVKQSFTQTLKTKLFETLAVMDVPLHRCGGVTFLLHENSGPLE
jgi:hypothetical protein